MLLNRYVMIKMVYVFHNVTILFYVYKALVKKINELENRINMHPPMS